MTSIAHRNRISPKILLTLLLLVLGITWTRFAWGSPEAQVEKFDAGMKKILNKYELTGGAIAVTHHGKLIFERAYGHASTGFFADHVPATPEHAWRVASVSKVLTSIGVLSLVDRGELGLDDSLIGLFEVGTDDSPADSQVRKITVRHLLQHRGGLFATADEDPMVSVNPPCPGDTKLWLLHHKLSHVPGEKYVYSNLGYCLLGEVIRQRTGGEPTQYLIQLFSAAGARSIKYGNQPSVHPEVTYFKSPDERSDPYTAFDIQKIATAGGAALTPRDLVLILDQLFRVPNHFIKHPETLRELTKPFPGDESKDTYYGLGVNVRKLPGGQFNIWHHGSLVGTTAYFAKFADGWTIAAFFNQRVKDRRSLSREIDRTLAGARRP